MTYQEKAAELIEKFLDPQNDGSYYGQLFAMRCAEIVCDEIINSNPSFEFWDSATGLELRPNKDYWEQVKKEIYEP